MIELCEENKLFNSHISFSEFRETGELKFCAKRQSEAECI